MASGVNAYFKVTIMKKPVILSFVLLLLGFQCVCQNRKGLLTLEFPFKLGASRDFVFVRGTGFSFNKSVHTDLSEYEHKNNYSEGNLIWSLAPRVGYFMDEVFMTGLDIQFLRYNQNKNEAVYHNYSIGTFLSRDFNPDKKISPYLEGSVGWGASFYEEHDIAPSGGKYRWNRKLNLFYYGLDLGVAYRVIPRLRLNLSVRFQDTIEKSTKRADSVANEEKIDNYEWAPILTICYSLGRTSKQK
jgi:hypothetical protein